jgi:hypothetical protein
MYGLSQDIARTIRDLLTQLPSLITLFVFMIVTLLRWRRHPKVSAVGAVSLFLLILHGLFFSTAYIWIVRWFPAASAIDQSRNFFNLLVLIGNVLFAITLALLIFTIFLDRKPIRA